MLESFIMMDYVELVALAVLLLNVRDSVWSEELRAIEMNFISSEREDNTEKQKPRN
jgi:hypothetical protein